MNRVPTAHGYGPAVLWLLVHLASTAVLAGIGWVVQVVVYPAFALVGDPQWAGYHRAHQRAIALVIFPPWLAQAVAVIGLILDGPAATDVALGVLALAGVALTVFAAVPAHGRLDPTDLRPLLRANLARTLVWTASATLSLVIALPSPP